MTNKKNYILATVSLLILFGVSFFHIVSRNETTTDVLILENIEAIAAGEIDLEGRIDCYSSFLGKNHGNKTVKDCGNCMDVDCEDCSDKGKCKK